MPAYPIGTTRINHGGYVEIKTGEKPAVWEFDHRVVWERAHGKLPQGHTIHHKNFDKTDNRLENLEACSSNSEHHRLYHAEELQRRGRAVGAWNKGKPKSPEHAAKIAAALRGKPKSPEHRAKLSAALAGRKLPPEHVAAIRAAQPPVTEEQRQRKREWAAAHRDPVTGRMLPKHG